MTGLISVAIRLLIGAGVLVAIVFGSFNWGKEACQRAQEAANAKIRGQYADIVADAMGANTARALYGQEKDLRNEEAIDDIVNRARAAEGANSECISADIYQRLRELQ